MDLRLFLDVIKRRALVIAVVTVVVILMVVTAGLLTRPSYSANATVRVLLDVGVTDLLRSSDYNVRLLNTYINILKSGPILEKAISLQSPPIALKIADLREQVQVEIIPNTELISIAVQHGNPAAAQGLANSLATLLQEYAQNLYTGGGGESARQIVETQLNEMNAELQSDRQKYAALLAKDPNGVETQALASQIKDKDGLYDSLLSRYETARLNESLRANSVTVIAPATLPELPDNRLGLTQIALGLIVGLCAGFGLALILENLDTRIHSSRQLELLTKFPVLGAVPSGVLPQNGSAPSQKAAVRRQLEEAYRLLGTNLAALRSEHVFKVVLITSATSQEGKSTVAANLALTLSEGGQGVYLVEGDVRRPSLGKMLEMKNGTGLTDLLNGRAPVPAEIKAATKVVPPCGPFVILSGSRVQNPTTLFASQSMSTLLASLGAETDITILDAPPILGIADVSVLAPRVDGVIVVVREAMTRREQLQAAFKQLQASRARVLGIVFIKKSGNGGDYGYY
jgi:capsular exopolysaccharide synthesis family protein